LGGVRVFRRAVGRAAGRGRFPAEAEVSHSGGRSVVPDPAGGVEVVGLDMMVLALAAESASGRVALLKIDCEGSEWGAFAGATRLDLVDRIAGEWHNYVDPATGRSWGPDDLAGLLAPFGFRVEYEPQPCGWGLFAGWR
jgi:hypothetical protein